MNTEAIYIFIIAYKRYIICKGIITFISIKQVCMAKAFSNFQLFNSLKYKIHNSHSTPCLHHKYIHKIYIFILLNNGLKMKKNGLFILAPLFKQNKWSN